jgi:hypothetical protein
MKYKLIKVDLREVNLSRMFDAHNKAGYIIISAYRGGELDPSQLALNKSNNQKLKGDIRKSGYSYFPVWGGFVEHDEETNQEREVKEPSFVVSSYKVGGNIQDNKRLFELGKEWSSKYQQESFLYKPAGDDTVAYFISPEGTTLAKFESISPTTDADAYFTSLHKSKSQNKPLKTTKSFTYKEHVVYMAQPPENLNEAYIRHNELFFRLKKDKCQKKK